MHKKILAFSSILKNQLVYSFKSCDDLVYVQHQAMTSPEPMLAC